MNDRNYFVTVCADCNQACCWHGEFMCEKASSAGTLDVLASDLDAMGLEHPHHYSIENLTKIMGQRPATVEERP
jgi:hypothetical protein